MADLFLISAFQGFCNYLPSPRPPAPSSLHLSLCPSFHPSFHSFFSFPSIILKYFIRNVTMYRTYICGLKPVSPLSTLKNRPPPAPYSSLCPSFACVPLAPHPEIITVLNFVLPISLLFRLLPCMYASVNNVLHSGVPILNFM